MTVPRDEDLMLEARNGDVRQLGVLFERHQKPLFNYYLRMTGGDRTGAEDLVQDVFFRILRSRRTYKPGVSFPVWMYRIARNARIDTLRKLRREAPLDPEKFEPRSDAPPADSAIAAKEDVELLRRAMALLPEDRREILILARYQNLRYEQIAHLLGCQEGAVKQRVFRAIRELREIYQDLARRKP